MRRESGSNAAAMTTTPAAAVPNASFPGGLILRVNAGSPASPSSSSTRRTQKMQMPVARM